ncbi:MAG: DUF2148 domain-containing protein [Candidatus Saganbacteria bacterium]|nr:DUF2148 domain-containing protein [Candidatus Saganbacteria bacterium]
MLDKEEKFRKEAVLDVAQKMCLAARTAPKGKGLDLIEIAIVTGDTIKKLSERMKEIGERENNFTLKRDCESILKAEAVVLIGTKFKAIGLRYCGLCGKKDCAEAEKTGTLCIYNPGDLGIAIGSAVSVAAAHHVDNRIMYSVGMTILDLKLLGEEVKIAFGIPLSVSSKNPFFDR